MGVAMPDGSYYVRNAADLQNAIDSVGRGENAGDNGNAIRKHIMNRAAKLSLQSRIPATWNPDGSLKHYDLDSYLAHFGVKGMKWGVERSASAKAASSGPSEKSQAKAAKLIKRAEFHEEGAGVQGDFSNKLKKAHADLIVNGTESQVFKDTFPGTEHLGPVKFVLQTGRSREQAQQELSNNLQFTSNQFARSANGHAAEAQRLRAKAEKLQHSDDDISDVLAHFGVKGMKWGQRKAGTGAASTHVSSDSARASELKSTVKKHGTAALSNPELQHLVTRLNLEQQHNRLNPAEVSAGKKILSEVLKIGGNVAKQEASKYAAEYADKGIKQLLEKKAA